MNQELRTQQSVPGLCILIRADLSAFLMRDLRSANRPAVFKAFLGAMLDPDFRLVAQVRLIQAMIRQGWKRLALLLYFRQKSRHAVDISPWATYGAGLRLMHAYNITIGPAVVIGSSCIIFNGVTLGNSRPDILRNVMPVVGDRCILGTGAKILGGIRIDDDVLIGANVVLRSDVMKGDESFLKLVASNQVRERAPLRWGLEAQYPGNG